MISVENKGKVAVLAIIDRFEEDISRSPRYRFPFVPHAFSTPGRVRTSVEMDRPSTLYLSEVYSGVQSRTYAFKMQAHTPVLSFRKVKEPNWIKGVRATAVVTKAVGDCEWEADILLLEARPGAIPF